MRGTNVKRQAWPDIGVVDNEFTQCFLATKDAEVEIKIDGVEGMSGRWWSLYRVCRMSIMGFLFGESSNLF